MSDARSVLVALEAKGIRALRLCADSRHVKPGDVFVALKGNRTDGRDYLAQAIKQGATNVRR